MKKGSFLKNYGFLICMLIGIVAGCIVGAIWPATKDASGEIVVKGATVLEPLGTVFLNLMFCIAVPTVFCSISSAIANMQSAKRAGKIMGVTIATFLATAAIAAVIMYVTVLIIPPVTGEYAMIEGEVGGTLGVADMIVNFFTKPDFTELFSRRAILPLIVVAVFSSVAMSGIPGGGGTGELVLCSIFFPDHLAVAFPIALALGNLVDPPATMVNSAGDYVVSFIVARFVDGKDWLQKQLQKQKAEQ